MNDSSSLSREIQKAESLVETARRLLADGRSLDLQALGGRIGGICRDLAALPQDSAERAGLRASAERLIQALDVLEHDLESRRRDAASIIAGERSRQANEAYGSQTPSGGRPLAAVEAAAKPSSPAVEAGAKPSSPAVEAGAKRAERAPGEGTNKDNT